MTHEAAATLLGSWGYPAYFLLFLASAVGSPITEDLLLLVGGYLIGSQVFTWPVALPIGYVGLVATDSLLYAFGRRLRAQTLRRGFIRRFIRPGRLRVATRWFARFGDRVVFFARLTPGTRVVVFVSAGVRGMPFGRFVAYDAIAAALWAPALLWLGHVLGERIGGANAVLSWIGDRVMWVIAILVGAFIVRQVLLVRAQKATGAEGDP